MVLFEVGHTFQVVLEAGLCDPNRTADVSAAVNSEGTTSWSSSSAAVLV